MSLQCVAHTRIKGGVTGEDPAIYLTSDLILQKTMSQGPLADTSIAVELYVGLVTEGTGNSTSFFDELKLASCPFLLS